MPSDSERTFRSGQCGVSQLGVSAVESARERRWPQACDCADDVARIVEVAARRIADGYAGQRTNVASILSLRAGIMGIADLIEAPIAQILH
jgi:hypothetical protein